MAYSDYGAFVWKNGKNITRECADTSYYCIKDGRKKVWKKYDEILKQKEKDLEEDTPCAGGHAVLQLDNFCIEFYKAYNPRIVYASGKKEDTEVLLNPEYTNKKLKLKITGFPLGNNEIINMFEIYYKGDYYCVVCGSQVGNGLEENHTSKYILKNMKYNEENNLYFINHNINDIDTVFDKLERLDDIRFKKYCLKTFGIKPLLRDIKDWNFNGIKFHFLEILRYRREIKWLK